VIELAGKTGGRRSERALHKRANRTYTPPRHARVSGDAVALRPVGSITTEVQLPPAVEQIVCDELAVRMFRHQVATVPVSDRVLIVPLPTLLVSAAQPPGSQLVSLADSVWDAFGIARVAPGWRSENRIEGTTQQASLQAAIDAEVDAHYHPHLSVRPQTTAAEVTQAVPASEVGLSVPLSVRDASAAQVLFDAVSITTYGANAASLLDVSGQVRGGELACIIGANKRSGQLLFEVVAGVRMPSSGLVMHGGSPVQLTVDQGFRPGLLADLPEALDESVTVVDFVARPSLASSMADPYVVRQNALETVSQLGLGSYAHVPVCTLSSAQARLAGVARALAPGSQVRCLADPLREQPAHIAAAIRQLVIAAAERGDAVVVLTDDAALVRGANRIFGVSEGRLLEVS
jgi:energy-coupling factor transporter ATP-binding protein EcfA2